jgi:hypothetical protein
MIEPSGLMPTLNDPLRSNHNLKTTTATIKKLLADGTPDWFKHPLDYKNFVAEGRQYDREISIKQVIGYRMEDQDLLIDESPRKVNVMASRLFVRKLRQNGIKCFTIYNGLAGTVGLWACPPNSDQMRYVAFIQIPYMYEWSVLRLDKNMLPDGEKFRGWRTVIAQLIIREILTEKQANRIFGRATDSAVSRRYRKSLCLFRNRDRSQEFIPEEL